jgi:hypothetical protein
LKKFPEIDAIIAGSNNSEAFIQEDNEEEEGQDGAVCE